MASHQGYVGYTVGQRKGLGGGYSKRLYVSGINTDTREVVLGERADLLGRKVLVGNMNHFIDNPAVGSSFMVQLRYNSRPIPCRIVEATNKLWKVELDEPVFAISPGQSAVFYSGEILVAGGKIMKADI